MIFLRTPNEQEQELIAKMAIMLASGSHAFEKLAQLPNFENYYQIMCHFIDNQNDGDWLVGESSSHELWREICGIDGTLDALSAGEALQWAYDRAECMYYALFDTTQAHTG